MEDAAAGDEPPPRASTSGKPASGLALVKASSAPTLASHSVFTSALSARCVVRSARGQFRVANGWSPCPQGPGGLPLTEAELQRWGTLSMRGNDATTAAEVRVLRGVWYMLTIRAEAVEARNEDSESTVVMPQS